MKNWFQLNSIKVKLGHFLTVLDSGYRKLILSRIYRLIGSSVEQGVNIDNQYKDEIHIIIQFMLLTLCTVHFISLIKKFHLTVVDSLAEGSNEVGLLYSYIILVYNTLYNTIFNRLKRFQQV